MKKRTKMQTVGWLGSAIAVIIAGCTVNTSPPVAFPESTPSEQTAKMNTPSSPNPTLTSAPDDWRQKTHIHAIATHPTNPQIVYLATHHGLLQRSEMGEWLQVGENRSDFMSLTADPTQEKLLYASGHPPSGGNLGLMASEDGGQTWEQIAMPGVDFHALAIAPNNPKILYGWATSGEVGFFTSKDGGKNWQNLDAIGLQSPFSLVVDPQNSDRLYAATRLGLMTSENSGKLWRPVRLTEEKAANIIGGLAATVEGEKTILYAYRLTPENAGIARSEDGGQMWQPLKNEEMGTILFLNVAPTNSQIIHAADDRNRIFRSRDGGQSWEILS